MRSVISAGAMQRLADSWRRQGVRIGFVPTMGYLHDGHLSLVREARRLVGRGGKVVVSIYVNPTQFGPKEDLRRYPRDLPRDLALCRRAGVDVVFCPTDAAIYPENASTWVAEEALSETMEGRARPGHFRGVTTVVAKLFHLVWPDVAVFGAKDYQQAAVIRRMVRDLHFPVKIRVAPTRRETDGLAMSSRNKYLAGDLRRQALVLVQAIRLAQAKVRGGAGTGAGALRRQLERVIARAPDARVDYISFFDPETLRPLRRVQPGAHLALAVTVGSTRLIDNARL
jgi:pantoate--beta-alanine ligase